jgi:hypothetical protein
LDQHEQHTHHAAKCRKGIFFEDGKGQKIERDKKGCHWQPSSGLGRLIRIGDWEKYQGSVCKCQTSKERIIRLLEKYQPKMSPNMRTIYGRAATGCCNHIGSP